MNTLEIDFNATMSAQLGAIHDELCKAREYRTELAQCVYPVYIPSQSGVVTAGGTLVISSPELLAPRMGWYWDVRRVTITGLASNTESVTIYKAATGSATDAQVTNVLTTIGGPTGVYTPTTAGCILRAKESLSVGGSSLTATERVVLTMDAIAVRADFIGLYLL